VAAVREAAHAAQPSVPRARAAARMAESPGPTDSRGELTNRAAAVATHTEAPEPISGPHNPRRGGAQHNSAQRSAAGQTDPAFLGMLASIAASCRQSRGPLSLVFAEIDHFDDVTLTRGPEGAQRIVRLLGTMCLSVGPADLICRQTRDERYALILPGFDRQAAVEVAQQLLRDMRRVGSMSAAEGQTTMTVSVGVAAVSLPPKNFDPEDLIDSAQRCLSAAQLSGGNALKSIEI